MQEHLDLTALSATNISFFTEHLLLAAFAECQIHTLLSYNHGRKITVKSINVFP